jgi:hypothetical protein
VDRVAADLRDYEPAPGVFDAVILAHPHCFPPI